MATRPGWISLLLVMGLAGGANHVWQQWRAERQAEAVKVNAQHARITMYTTDTCPYCKDAARWLNQHQIPWRECNLDRDASCHAAFEAQGSPGVPLLHVNGRWRLGFDPRWLAVSLADTNQP